MKDLSIIIPFAGEYPQAIFTVQAIAQSLLGKLDFEIIVVDNYCKELEDQWDMVKRNAIEKAIRGKSLDVPILSDVVKSLPIMNNRSAEAFKASEKGNPWLRYMKYDGRLSHWECKRLAVEAADSDTFLFVDAHTIPSSGIDQMFYSYRNGSPEGAEPADNYCDLGTFHMPLTYKILEWHRLIYKMVVENNFYGYSFTGFDDSGGNERPEEVPVMSCCGVMISRGVLEKIGGWPKHMYAYGGGENFLNYSLAVTGMKKWIYPGVTLHHHGDKRDYHYTFDGTLINRLTAHYLFGGDKVLLDLAKVSKGNPNVVKSIVKGIVENPDHQAHRQLIKNNQKTSLDDFVSGWKNLDTKRAVDL